MLVCNYVKTEVDAVILQKEMIEEGLPVEWVRFDEPDQLSVGYTVTKLTTGQRQLIDSVLNRHISNEAFRNYLQNVNAYRDEYLYSGIEFAGCWFDTQADSLTNLNATTTGLNTCALFGMPMPEHIEWTVQSNDEAIMTPQEFVTLSLSVMLWASAVYTACRRIKDEMIVLYKAGETEAAFAFDFKEQSRWPSKVLPGTIAEPIRISPANV